MISPIAHKPTWVKAIYILTASLMGSIIAITALVIALVAKSESQGSCQFWHDLAGVPTTSQSTKSLYTIIADARISFIRQGCDGTLPPLDQNVANYVPKNLGGTR